MDISIPIVFLIIGVLFFLLAIFEEREEKETDEEQDKADNLVVIFLVFSFVLLFVASAGFFYVTESFYTPISDTIETVYHPEFQALGWLCAGFGMFAVILAALKVLSIMYPVYEEG